MKTVFGLFEDYHSAATAVDTLLEKGFEYEELNVMVTRSTAENWLDQAPKEAEDESAEPSSLIDEMLDRHQGIIVPDTGPIYAAGQLANLIAKAAIDSDGSGPGLDEALESFNLKPNTAKTYREGIHGGGMLVFLRTEDERAAEAASTFREMKAKEISIPN
jgi:hypothetical protein